MKKNKKYSFRKLINDLHLWLGIASGIVLFLVCLSGTVYTFKAEIEQMLEPEKFNIKKSSEKKSFEDIITTIQKETHKTVTRLSFYDNPYKPYELQVVKEIKDRRGETIYVNPYNQNILGTGKGPSSDFFMFFFKMHRWLLLDQEIGRPIVGAATILFVILILSGLFLWFPKKIKGFKNLKSGLKIKFNAKWKRINYDLHNVLGFYSFLLLLIMALSGLNWSFDWYKNGMSAILGKKVFYQRDEKKMHSTLVENRKTLAITDFLKISDSILPYKGKTTITLPKSAEDAIEIIKINETKFNKTGSDKLIFDQYSGHILKKEIFADKSLGDKIASQMRSIHMGDLYGLTSKVSYFIACLIATSLPITGIFIWLNKIRKRKTS